MGETTAISWTDHTFNPWWGCARVSPGCQNCYAEAFAKRTGHDVWGKGGDRRFFGDKHWNEPRKWDRAAAKAGRSALVFCASMADVFEDREDLIAERERLFALIAETPHLIWLLLTKRPENVYPLVPLRWTWESGVDWPANAWIGTTVEDQQRANERIPHLLGIPAPVRFLSCEPLLGRVSLRWGQWHGLKPVGSTGHLDGAKGIGWVIVGGESGPRHRPFDTDNARSLRDECDEAGIPFFFKQHGGRTPTAGGHELDGQVHHAWPSVARREALR